MRKSLTKFSRIVECGALFMVFPLDSKGAKVRTSCRFRYELSNEYLLAKFGADTAENGSLKVCQKLAKS